MFQANICRRMIWPAAILSVFAMVASAQESTSPLGNVLGVRARPGNNGFDAVVETASLDIYLQQQSGLPIEGVAVVTLLNLSGQVYRQVTTKEAHLTFNYIHRPSTRSKWCRPYTNER